MLKTLKDLKMTINQYGESTIYEEDLKQEAIKWAKHGKKELIKHALNNDTKSVRNIWGGIEAFKNFFNLKEEEIGDDNNNFI